VTAGFPVVLIPGLLTSARLYAEQIPALWRCGPVLIADHTRDDSLTAIARRILDTAPPRFALVGLSMGGYIAFEIMRQASQRVIKLALLDTSARADTPEQSQRRRELINFAQGGRFAEIPALQFPQLVHPAHQHDAALRQLLRQMAEEVGAEAFVRQQQAIMTRSDSRPSLAAVRCPTLVLVGDGDALTPPELAAEIAAGIVGARRVVVQDSGHLSTLEQPQRVTQALLEWLQT
jgi:pimeloyl-ACP methyl ester carboxylesterase